MVTAASTTVSAMISSIKQPNATSNTTIKVKLQDIQSPFTANYFEIVILALLIVAILLGNGLVCLAYKTVSRRLKTITNSFVISLAASDILVGAISLPLWVTFRTGYIMESSIFYFLYIAFDILCGSSSIMNLTVISIERMYAVRFPAKHRNIAHKRSVIVSAVICIWAFSIALASLSVLKLLGLWSGYTYLVVVCAFVLPTMIIIMSYLMIFHTMKYRQEQHWRFKREMRLAMMIGIVIILFLICWFPFFMFNILLHHSCPCKTDHYLYPLIPVVKYMHYTNSLMNPIIYAARYPDYRNAFKKMLLRCSWSREEGERQRSASIRSTLSTMAPSTHDEYCKERDGSFTTRTPSRLSVAIDHRDRRGSDQRLLLSPTYKSDDIYNTAV